MAKNRKRQGERDTSVSLTSLLSPSVTPAYVKATPVADRRTFHPERAARPALSFGQKPAKITVKDRRYTALKKPVTAQAQLTSKKSITHKFRSQTRAAIAFAHPKTVPVCVRRHQRREVLHALKRTGKGSGKPRRTWLSNIRC